MKTISKVKDYIIKNQMIDSGDRIVIGVSGGADSVCLVFVLKELSKELKLELCIVNIEHGIRGDESKTDSAFVKSLSEKLNIPFIGYEIDVPKKSKEMKESIETAARNARYDAFFKAAKEFGANKIAVAHNANDNVETMIFNMARGTSFAGLSGIPPANHMIIRPLLCLTRAEIERYAEENGLDYVTDSTNFETDYSRNKIRHQVLPKLMEINSEAVTHLTALGNDANEIMEFVNTKRDEVYDSVTHTEHECIIINRETLKKEPEIIQREVIKKCIEEVSKHIGDISRANLSGVIELMKLGTGKSIYLPGYVIAENEYEQLIIKKAVTDKPENHKNQINVLIPGKTEFEGKELITSVMDKVPDSVHKKKYTKLIDYDRINTGLMLRYRRTGDVIATASNGGHTKLKDYFINEKVPKDIRDKILLVCDGNEVVWVVGMRLSEKYKINKATTRVLSLEIMEEEKWLKKYQY